MYLLLAGVGFLLIPVSLVLLLVFFIRKRPKKIPLLLLCAGFVLVVAGSLMMPESDRVQASSAHSVAASSAQPVQSEPAQTVQPVETATPEPTQAPTVQPTESPDPLSYVVVSTQDYIRDGQECIAYRIVCSPDLTEKQMIKIYNLVIDGDGKYLHTVWMYKSASAADGSGLYDIAMIEELEQGKTPEITLA